MRVAVVGAGFAGLLAATAAARCGHRVTVLERDTLPSTARPRPGVPQGSQPHVLLRRGLAAIETLLPGTGEALLAHGGVAFSTGRMPWLGEYGWARRHHHGHEIISLTRPLLEQVVRERVRALPGLELREGVTARALVAAPDGWQLPGTDLIADLIIDASGRSSRLPHWLRPLGVDVGRPAEIDARVGYSSRAFRGPAPLTTGMVIEALPTDPRGGLVLPVEDGTWLVGASGFGAQRPGRDEADYVAFLAGLRDSALSDMITRLEPVGDVTVHRQTGNRRYAYGRTPRWPAGLLAVGDAACAFNPLYGQGITVAALQAQHLGDVLRTPPTTSSLTRTATAAIQRRLETAADVPWEIATAADRRMPSCPASPTAVQRLQSGFTGRMVRLATGGDPACARAFTDVYHLLADPKTLAGPAVVTAVARSVVRGVPPPATRPAELAALAGG